MSTSIRKEAATESLPQASLLKRWGLGIQNRAYLFLVGVYIVSTLLHIAIFLSTAVIPSIMADEILYFDLAQSLSAGTGFLVRGQPVVYPYIGYPLFIAPLFHLPEGINVYHAIVVWNCLAIHLMIFPIYALGRDITKKPSTALGIAVLTTLMPDFFMAKHVMVESAAYPLLALALLVAFRGFRSPGKVRRSITSGLLFFLLYILKPSYAALGPCTSP